MRKLLAFVFVFVSLYSYSQGNVVSICGGSSATLQATNPNGLVGPTYSLNPGGFSSVGGTFVVSPPATTSYTLYTTGQDIVTNSVVTNSVVVQVSVTAQPAASPTFTQATCTSTYNAVNLNLSYNPASPVPGYTLTWLPLPPSSVLSPSQATATALSPGPYTVEIVAAGGCSAAVLFTMYAQPAPANFSVTPYGSTHSITCLQPTLELQATNPNLTYTWSSTSSAPVLDYSVALTGTNVGVITVLGQNPTTSCTATYTFLLVQNIAAPSATLSTTAIAINCTQTAAPTLSVIANPSINVSNYIYSPGGGTFVANSYTTIMPVTGVGVFTHVAINDANGCTSGIKTFTVTSNDNYPRMDIVSPNNFTLGCTTKSVGTINIINGATTPTAGGPVSYTIIGPPTSTDIANGNLNGTGSFTLNVPGTWTVMIKDNNNGCITRVPISVIQNTFTPLIQTTVPRQILDCTNSTTILEGFTETPNVSYNWGFVNPGGPGNVNSYSITVPADYAKATQTLLNTYTLTVTDNNNTCKSFTIVPMYQNLFAPTTGISGTNSLTCLTTTVMLSNQSASNIPPIFPKVLPVVGFLWTGPTPQVPLQVSSTYVAGQIGTYTLISKDLNNGCVSTGTFFVRDERTPPIVLATLTKTLDCGLAKVTLSVDLASTTNLTYSWIPPGGAGPGGDKLSKNYDVSTAGLYTVVITNTLNGCKTPTVVKAVTGSLTAQFTTDLETGYAPLQVHFTNTSFSSNGPTGVASFWSFGNGLSYSITNPTGTFVPPSTTYTLPGTYTVTMFAIKGACMDTSSTVITVEIPAALEIPNVFTPNGDGANDLFFLKATNLSDINMSIFDRWGHLVYELKTDKGAVEWDGKNQYGKEAADGTYFYVIKATGKDGQTWDKKGTLSLFR